MGEAKRRRAREGAEWPNLERAGGVIELQFLPSVPEIGGKRMRTVLDDPSIPDDQAVILQAFAASAGDRTFCVGFTLGDESGISPIGALVMERLAREAPDAPVHVVPVAHEDIAWDVVLRHLRTFAGRTLLFIFPNSDVYDAGTAEKYYSTDVRMIAADGQTMPRGTLALRRRIRAQKAALLDRPPPPTFDGVPGAASEDAPWVFRMRTPGGKSLLAGVWNGRRDYAHELPADICRWVGGDRIAIVQVDRPVGVDRRSSLELTHSLAKDFDGVIHWARDTETFQSIVKSFVRLDIESVPPPELSDAFEPDLTILAANTDAAV